MKRFLSIVTLITALIMAVSCNKEEAPGLEFSSFCNMKPVFEADGGEFEYKFSVRYNWSVEVVDGEWLSVEPASGTPADGKFTLKALGHDGGEERENTVKITLSNGETYAIPVKQKMRERFDVSDPKEYYTVAAEGGELNIAFATNLEYTISIANSSSWVHAAETRTMRNESICLSIDRNDTQLTRIANVAVRDVRYDQPALAIFTIIQSANGEPLNEIIYESDEIIELATTEGFGSNFSRHIHDSRYGRIIFDSAVESIPAEGFAGHTDITSIQLPESLQSIESEAFSGCTDITKFTLPAAITDIGSAVFNGCSFEQLTITCNIPDQIVENPEKPGRMMGIGCDDARHWLYGSDIKRIVLSSRLGEYAFCNSGLESVEVTTSVRNIDEGAFMGCSNIAKVTVGSLEQWCTLVFGSGEANPLANGTAELIINGQHLTTFTAPESLDAIGMYTFYGYTDLTAINIGDHIKSVGQQCFAGCGEVESIYLGSGIKTVGQRFIDGCITDELTINVNIPDMQKGSNKSEHWLCGVSATKVTYGERVTEINNMAISDMETVTTITIGESVEHIGEGAFNKCTALTSVTFEGNAVESIDKHAFNECTALTNIVLPDGLKSIGSCAFQDASSLESVTIPASVTSIGSYTFNNCTAIEAIECKSTTPPTLGEYALQWSASPKYTIYVPTAAVDAYLKAPEWSKYANAIVGKDF